MANPLEAAMKARREAERLISEGFEGAAYVAGVTVFAIAGDDSFSYPLVSGPSDEHIAGFDPHGRRVMAHTLRELADRWEAGLG